MSQPLIDLRVSLNSRSEFLLSLSVLRQCGGQAGQDLLYNIRILSKSLEAVTCNSSVNSEQLLDTRPIKAFTDWKLVDQHSNSMRPIDP